VDEFMGWSETDAVSERQAQLDLQTQIDEMLVVCMDARGFEYAPYEGPTGDRPVFGVGLSDSEFMLEFGYGVFTSLYDDARWNSQDQSFEGLEPDEWYWSFADDPEFMAALDECTVQIEEELGRPEPGFHESMMQSLDEAWGPLHSELEEIPRRIEKDSRYVEAEKTWSICMADSGYEFATGGQIEDYLWAKRGEYEEAANLGTVLLTESFEKDIRPFVDEELAIAAADVACRTELDKTREELRLEYEGLFIDKHRAQLEEIRTLEQELREVLMQGWQHVGP
jgi:hypothetical protein